MGGGRVGMGKGKMSGGRLVQMGGGGGEWWIVVVVMGEEG